MARAETARAAAEAEKALHSGRGHAFPAGTPILRTHSRRGYPDTLTFTEVDEFPSTIRANASSRGSSAYPKQARCVVTGRPARYMDPLSGKPYADAAAFAVLRQRFAQQHHGMGGLARVSAALTASISTSEVIASEQGLASGSRGVEVSTEVAVDAAHTGIY